MLNRISDIKQATIVAGQSLSSVIDLSKYSGGIIKNDADDWTEADILFEVSESETGTFTTLKDKAGTVLKLSSLPTDAGFARVLPDELFAVRYLKLRSVTVSTETSKNQANAQSFTFILKS